jgi:hypothetical protein
MKYTKIFGTGAALTFVASFVFLDFSLFLLLASVWLASLWFLALAANGII